MQTDSLVMRKYLKGDTADASLKSIIMTGAPHSASVSDSICFMIGGRIYRCTKAEFLTAIGALPLHGKADNAAHADNSDSLNHHAESYIDTINHGAINTAIAGKLGLHDPSDSTKKVPDSLRLRKLELSSLVKANLFHDSILIARGNGSIGYSSYDSIRKWLDSVRVASRAWNSDSLGHYIASAYLRTISGLLADSATIADSCRGGSARLGGKPKTYYDSIIGTKRDTSSIVPRDHLPSGVDTGSGTTNYYTIFTGVNKIGNSYLSQPSAGKIDFTSAGNNISLNFSQATANKSCGIVLNGDTGQYLWPVQRGSTVVGTTAGISNASASIIEGSKNSSMLIGNHTNAPIYLFVNNVVRATINSTGLGIGTTAPSCALTIKGDLEDTGRGTFTGPLSVDTLIMGYNSIVNTHGYNVAMAFNSQVGFYWYINDNPHMYLGVNCLTIDSLTSARGSIFGKKTGTLQGCYFECDGGPVQIVDTTSDRSPLDIRWTKNKTGIYFGAGSHAATNNLTCASDDSTPILQVRNDGIVRTRKLLVGTMLGLDDPIDSIAFVNAGVGKDSLVIKRGGSIYTCFLKKR
jgi:hypothetical protein